MGCTEHARLPTEATWPWREHLLSVVVGYPLWMVAASIGAAHDWPLLSSVVPRRSARRGRTYQKIERRAVATVLVYR
jgi:hypothetical protein